MLHRLPHGSMLRPSPAMSLVHTLIVPFLQAFKFTNPQPVKCAWEGRDNAHVFRWYSASVQGVMLTAHSCNFTFNYPLLNIFKSASQTGNASTLACMISSLSYENEGAHSGEIQDSWLLAFVGSVSRCDAPFQRGAMLMIRTLSS